MSEQRVWVMLHSGSRGIGNAIGSYFIERAKEDMRALVRQSAGPGPRLSAGGRADFDDYVEAVGWAQDFAAMNRAGDDGGDAARRRRRARSRPSTRRSRPSTAITTTSSASTISARMSGSPARARSAARQGDLGIIPGSMGARSYIVRGKGNPESFDSCSHGAGRAMSRGEAKRRFTLDDHAAATAGVECRKDAGVIDETPGGL